MNYLHVNTEPDRAYYLVSQRLLLSGFGEKSDRFLLLSGSWQFQYFESVYDSCRRSSGRREQGREKRRRFLPYGRVTAWMETSISTPADSFPFDPPYVRGNPRAV